MVRPGFGRGGACRIGRVPRDTPLDNPGQEIEKKAGNSLGYPASSGDVVVNSPSSRLPPAAARGAGNAWGDVSCLMG